ncbi:MAG: hypothetical protein OEW75_04900 [Cyclobacteriaceae bacterium]|nr:hypothetical protein [Cyclobacteriaceae bacterium]
MSEKDIDQLFRNKLENARYNPSEAAWGKISSQLNPELSNRKFYWGIAAGILVIFVTGILLGVNIGKKENIQDLIVNHVEKTESPLVNKIESSELKITPNEQVDKELNQDPSNKSIQNNTKSTKSTIYSSKRNTYLKELLSEEPNSNTENNNGSINDETVTSKGNSENVEIAESVSHEEELPKLNEIETIQITAIPDLTPGKVEIEEPLVKGTEEEDVSNERGKTLKKMLSIARELTTDNDGWGALREAKNDLLVIGKKKETGGDE